MPDEAAVTTTDPSAPVTSGADSPNRAARLAALADKIDRGEMRVRDPRDGADEAETGDEEAEGTTNDAVGAAVAPAPPASPPASAPPVDAQRDERLAVIERAMAAERAAFEANHASKRREAELAEREAKLAEREAKVSGKTIDDMTPEDLISAAISKGATPQEAADIWIKFSQPEVRAQYEAQRHAAKVLTPLEQRLKDLEERDAKRAAEAAAEETRQQVTEYVSGLAQQYSAEIPLVAALIADGDQGSILRLCEKHSRILQAKHGDSVSMLHVLPEVERELRTSVAKAAAYHQRLQGQQPNQAPSETSSATASRQRPSPAAVRGNTTLTNQAVSESAAVPGRRESHSARVRRMAERFER